MKVNHYNVSSFLQEFLLPLQVLDILFYHELDTLHLYRCEHSYILSFHQSVQLLLSFFLTQFGYLFPNIVFIPFFSYPGQHFSSSSYSSFLVLDLLPQLAAPTLRHFTRAPEAYALGYRIARLDFMVASIFLTFFNINLITDFYIVSSNQPLFTSKHTALLHQ